MEEVIVVSNQKKFEACYRKYYGRIVKFLTKLVGNLDIAEDLAQETFTKLYAKNVEISPDSPTVRGFLFTVARNTAFDFLKQQKLEESKYREVFIEEIAFEKTFFEDLENYFIHGEVISTLHDVIDSMPQRKREIIEQKFFAKAKDSALLRKMNISRYMIKKIEQDFFEKIRDNLNGFFENTKAEFEYR